VNEHIQEYLAGKNKKEIFMIEVQNDDASKFAAYVAGKRGKYAGK
jgi:hypothetical protein